MLIILWTLLFAIKGSQSASPSKPLCLEENRIAWRGYQPYIMNISNVNNTGVVSNLFRIALRSCCRGELNLIYQLEYSGQNEAAGIAMNDTIDFIMPVQMNTKSKKYLTKPFVSAVDSPGFAFYVLPNPSAGEAIVQAISSTWPLITLMFLLVAISGTIFCLIEAIILGTSFPRKIVHGFWWAFVSMTTVGYGDICPKTKAGKLFSIVWVLTGVACCALFTSFITSILTSAVLHESVTMSGLEIAVIQGSEEHKYTLKKNGIPTAFHTIDEIIKALADQRVQGALIDSYVAAGYQEELSKYHLDGIIEYVSSNGIVFTNKGLKYASCVRDYFLSRQAQVFEMIAENVEPIKMSMMNSAVEKSQNLVDPTQSSFLISIFGMAIALVIIFIVGVLWDKREIWRKKEDEGLSAEPLLDQGLTLTEWRQRYKSNLYELLQSIQADTESIRMKCESITDKISLQNTGLVTLKKDMMVTLTQK